MKMRRGRKFGIVIAGLMVGGLFALDLLRREIGTPGFISEVRMGLPLVGFTYLGVLGVMTVALVARLPSYLLGFVAVVAAGTLVLASRSIAYDDNEIAEIRHYWVFGVEETSLPGLTTCIRVSDWQITFSNGTEERRIFRGIWPWSFSPSTLEMYLAPLCESTGGRVSSSVK